MKIKFFKKENKFKKKDFVFNLNLYWELAVCVSLILIVFSFFFGYQLFMRINREPILPVGNDSGQVPTVDKDRLGKILNYFSDREKKLSNILNSPAPVVDPSL